jgi:hypothetical protein
MNVRGPRATVAAMRVRRLTSPCAAGVATTAGPSGSSKRLYSGAAERRLTVLSR